ncbi:MAG: hypothetical protein JL50_15755 [Peptococcaceae bacterium BICA1-7]|nr:MAG: hypothetical protein JL50_15755 [Peptococcaceae bacterium BICA1-7]HBV96755.1 precorrin-6A reductase [Desulfotomaculum sp.]
MILVIGGTSDSRAIAAELVNRGAPVLVSTATGHGAGLAAGSGIEVVQGRLDREQLRELLDKKSIKALVDSSHPYAELVSQNAAAACEESGIPYIRYSRPREDIPPSPLIETVDSYEEAAARACAAGNTIIAATGSKTAGIFTKGALGSGKRIIFRVIPDPGIIEMLISLGVAPNDIVAMQGPFSEEMNIALIRHCRADVMVTKESGSAGGFLEKARAAEKTGVLLIVVKRPPEPEGAVCTVEQAVSLAIGYIND